MKKQKKNILEATTKKLRAKISRKRTKRKKGEKKIIKPSASATAAKIVDPSQFTYRIYNQTHMCVAFRFHIISSAIQILYVSREKPATNREATRTEATSAANKPAYNDDNL